MLVFRPSFPYNFPQYHLLPLFATPRGSPTRPRGTPQVLGDPRCDVDVGCPLSVALFVAARPLESRLQLHVVPNDSDVRGSRESNIIFSINNCRFLLRRGARPCGGMVLSALRLTWLSDCRVKKNGGLLCLWFGGSLENHKC